jgi:predicted transcriptional regulator
MSGRNFSVRVPHETLEEIDAVARAQARSRNFVVAEAIDRYLAEERRWIAQVKKGLAEADAGRFVSDGDMTALFREFERKSRRTAIKRRK